MTLTQSYRVDDRILQTITRFPPLTFFKVYNISRVWNSTNEGTLLPEILSVFCDGPCVNVTLGIYVERYFLKGHITAPDGKVYLLVTIKAIPKWAIDPTTALL